MKILTSSVGKWSSESAQRTKLSSLPNLFDVNGALIRVPYQSPNESLLLLLKYYLEITERKKKISNEKIIFWNKFNGRIYNPTSELKISNLLKEMNNNQIEAFIKKANSHIEFSIIDVGKNIKASWK
jgi:hypothetical protein